MTNEEISKQINDLLTSNNKKLTVVHSIIVSDIDETPKPESEVEEMENEENEA
jgi:hypothetical protein